MALDELTRPEDTEPPDESSFKRAVEIGPHVWHFHEYSRDGELLSEPDVAFEAIVNATPRSFEVTIHYSEETYVAILPVMCRREWILES